MHQSRALAWTARLLAAFTVATTLLPISPTGRSAVRVWDFPRIHLAIAGLLAAAGLRVAHRRAYDSAGAAAALGCVLYHASKIIPFTPLYRKQVATASSIDSLRRIRLVTANVYMKNRGGEAMLRVLLDADADIICLLEPDAWWEEFLRPLEQHYAFAQKCALDNTYGMLLYSRLPIRTEVRFLVQDDVPSMKSWVKLPSGDEIVVHCLHPRPPVPPNPSYGRDAELVLVAREIEGDGKPAIAMGDLNDVAWSYTTRLFKKISRTVDPRIGRGLYNTFHAGVPVLRFPLDHVFHTPHFSLIDFRRLSAAGSDHFPVLIDLLYEPENLSQQPPPPENAADREQANEMVADVNEHNLPRHQIR